MFRCDGLLAFLACVVFLGVFVLLVNWSEKEAFKEGYAAAEAGVPVEYCDANYFNEGHWRRGHYAYMMEKAKREGANPPEMENPLPDCCTGTK